MGRRLFPPLLRAARRSVLRPGGLVVAALAITIVFWGMVRAESARVLVEGLGGGTVAGQVQPGAPQSGTLRQVPNELLVRFRLDAPAAARHTALSAVPTVRERQFRSVKNLHHLRLAEGATLDSTLQALRSNRNVAYAEPNYLVQIADVPTDTRFPDQWPLQNTGQTGGTAGADIAAVPAWDITTGSSDVVVAILDTGIDYLHEDLAANVFTNPLECGGNPDEDDDGNGYVDDCHGIDTANNDSDPMDDSGHGTHVAGTIGAASDNGIGVAGVSWDVTLLPCKFLDSSGWGTTAAAIACLDYVATMKDRGVNVVATNNSWGGGAESQALADAIEAQQQRGILFIASAGNSGRNNDLDRYYPCTYDSPNVVCAAATDSNDQRAGFSSYGAATVHLGAPGDDVLSTLPGDAYGLKDGTSMASPHVSGVAALLYSQDPNRDWKQVKNLLLSGGQSLSSLHGSTMTGRRLDAHGSLTCSGSSVLSRLRPSADVIAQVGRAVPLSVLNVECDAPGGTVDVMVTPGSEIIYLVDDGTGRDPVADDGEFSGAWVPSTVGTFTLAFPDGSETRVDVYLTPPEPGIIVTPQGNGTGTVTSSPPGIACGTVCEAPFPIWYGTVRLGAVPDPGSVFAGWSGVCSPATVYSICYVDVEDARHYLQAIATFDLVGTTHSVSVSTSGVGTVVSSPAGIDCGSACDHSFTSGTVVTLAAPAPPGYALEAWGGDCSGRGACTLVIDSPKVVTARFAEAVFTQVASLPIEVARGDAAWGDYDSDGDLDVVVNGAYGSTATTQAALYRNDFGVFVDSGANLDQVTGFAAWGDYDNDADLDLVTGGWAAESPSSNRTQLYRNDGGNMAPVSSPFVHVGFEPAAAWGDYDNDGDLDLVMAGAASGVGPATVLYRNEDGTFVDANAGLLGTYYSDLAWADYDNDGDLDLLLAAWDQTVLYRNDDGTLVDSGASIVGVSNSSVDWADYDLDGDLDLAISGEAPNDLVTKVYRNDAGSFAVTGADIVGVYFGGVWWGDYDSDGDPDLLVSGHGSPNGAAVTALYRNDAGGLTRVFTGLPDTSSSHAAWGDYDNDGRLDLVLLGSNPASTSNITAVFRNLRGAVNTPPTTPDGLAAAAQAGETTFGWDPSTDPETATASLSYNLRVGTTPGGSEVLSPMADHATGFRRVPRMGNTGLGTTHVLRFLTPGTYYWAVQSIDAGGAASPFSAEQVLEVAPSGVVTVTKTGSGNGRLVSDPPGIDCGDLCSASFDPAATVTLTASPDPGSVLISWGGACEGTSLTCTVNFFAGEDVTAQFERLHHLDVSLVGAGTGIVVSTPEGIDCGVGCSALFANGTVVTLTATPSADSDLVAWGGACALQSNPCTFTMHSDVSVTADFAPSRSHVSITHAWVDEGDSGTVNARFWLYLQPTRLSRTTVLCATANVTAEADTDYVARTGECIFAPGDRYCYFDVTVNGDTDEEPDEQFAVHLSASQEADISIGEGRATILDDDSRKSFRQTQGLLVLEYGNSSWGDYDNDGDLDLAVVGMYESGGTSISRVYRNDSGTLVNSRQHLLDVEGFVAWGDYDNDSDLDLLLGGWSALPVKGHYVRLYRNDAGEFVEVDAGLPSGTGFFEGAWGDYDNDGDLDLALAFDSGGGAWDTRVYRNDPGGMFVDIDAGLARGGSVDWGDFDRDGDLDLLTAGDGAASHVYRNEGGVFTDAGAGLVGFQHGGARWIDYDADGDLDVMVNGVPHLKPHLTRLYRNEAGAFVDAEADLAGIGTPPTWGDFDADGDPDMLFTGYDGVQGVTRLYRNASGVFAETASSLPHVRRGSSSWADFDLDGRLDVHLCGKDSSTGWATGIYRNIRAATNAPPEAPEGTGATVTGTDLHLTWHPAVDAETPSPGLSYNVRVGTTPGGDDVVSGMADPSTGFRRVARAGNAGSNTTFTLRGLPPGPYYWAVQAIDTSYTASAFTPGGSIEIPLGVSVDDAGLSEGDCDISGLVFGVTLAHARPTAVTVSYETRDGTATAGEDYIPTSGTLTFDPGMTSLAVEVPIFGDTLVEGDESLTLKLTGSSEGVLVDDSGAGTILNDDSDPAAGTEPVVWATSAGVDVCGSSLTKTAPGGWGNAGAASWQRLAAGDGYVEFTASENGTTRMLGLGREDSSTSREDIDFAIQLAADGEFSVYERGSLVRAVGSYSPGDTFRVASLGGRIWYSRNGAVFQTSNVAPTYPLLVDTALDDFGGTLKDVVVAGFSAAPPPTWDFNGDRQPDILWQHDSGTLSMWTMDGTSRVGTVELGVVPQGWTIRGLGDFSRDGSPDVLWRHESGLLYVSFMRGTSFVGESFLSPAVIPADWRVRGIADLNDDGRLDIVWRHNSGSAYVWFMGGTSMVSGAYLAHGFVDSGWRIQGLTDFNGDSQEDVLWRHDGGSLYLWYMHGTSLLGGTVLDPGLVADPQWQIVRVADFDEDGSPDILWHHQGLGILYVWHMNGPALASGTYLDPSLAPGGSYVVPR